jgi:hypothetical protein
MTGNDPWPMIVDVLNGKAGESGKEKEEEAHFQQSTRFKLSIPIECVPGDLLLSFVFLKLAHRQSSPASRETRKMQVRKKITFAPTSSHELRYDGQTI